MYNNLLHQTTNKLKKSLRELEKNKRKIIKNKWSKVFNLTCLNENILLNYTKIINSSGGITEQSLILS